MTSLESCVGAHMEELSDTQSTASSLITAFKDVESKDRPAPSKSSLLIPGVHTDDMLCDLDSRFFLEPQESEPSGRAFSQSFLVRAWQAYTSIWFGHTNFHALVLRHDKADKCPAGIRCTHWRLAGNDRPTAEEGTIELQLVCVTSEFVANGDPDADKYHKVHEVPYMFDDEADLKKKITCPPCHMFNALKPDFGLVEKAGYVVVNFRFIESDHRGDNRFKWMDRYGRLISLLSHEGYGTPGWRKSQ